MKWDSGPVSANANASDQVVFWGIEASRPSEPSGFSNVTIDDSYVSSPSSSVVSLVYAGHWTHLDSSTASSNSTEDSHLGNYFNQTLSVSQSATASVTFSGQGKTHCIIALLDRVDLAITGSAIYLYGTVGPDYGAASITLDNEIVEPSMNCSVSQTLLIVGR